MRFIILMFLTVAVAGCSDATTSVRLQIAAASSLSLDGLAVTVDGARHDEAMAESIQLLVPDRWAGLARRIEVEGTHRGAPIAAGAIVVTPIAGREVTARVTLVDASCDLICNVGDVDCDGDAVVTCELGMDGCPVWGVRASCSAPTPFCSTGACSNTCTDDCAAGATKCEGATGERTCGQSDSDSCLDWSPAVACGSSEVCHADSCGAALTLTVAKTGPGTGIVTSSPTGVVCGATCTASYVAGTTVTLSATPDASTTFVGWSGGGCSGANSCVVTLSAATQVTASFAAGCPEPTCTLLDVATGQDAAEYIALDDTHVYWTNSLGDSVVRRTKAAGTPETLATGQDGARGIAIDDTHVYWTTGIGDTVMRRTKAPGGLETLAVGQDGVAGIALDATHVYWVNMSDDTVMRRTKAPGTPETVATGQDGAYQIAVDGTHIYWITTAGLAGGNVMRRTKAPGTPETLASGQDFPTGITVDATHIYWTTLLGETVMRRTKAPGSLETFVTGQSGAYRMTLDATHVYWTTRDSAPSVMRRTKAPGSPETLAATELTSGIVVDDSHVYWTTNSGVQRLSRCACGL